MTSRVPTIGLVLAGGRGSRLGCTLPKPLTQLRDRPLLRHILERLAPQVDEFLISGALDVGFEAFGPVVADEGKVFQGPAAGIIAGMTHLAARFDRRPFAVVTAAADTPFLPRDLVERLAASSVTDGVCVATFRGEWVPTFALWPCETRHRLCDVANRSLRSIIEDGPFGMAAFPDGDDAPGKDPFFNINTPDDLRRARQHLGGAEFT